MGVIEVTYPYIKATCKSRHLDEAGKGHITNEDHGKQGFDVVKSFKTKRCSFLENCPCTANWQIDARGDTVMTRCASIYSLGLI